MSDGYVILKASSLSWLIEHLLAAEQLKNVPEDIAKDLGHILVNQGIREPIDQDKVKSLGPILTVDEHEHLLLQSDLRLPTDKQSGQFWRMVMHIVHTMLQNEADAIMHIVEKQ